jgi:hypothetical protein
VFSLNNCLAALMLLGFVKYDSQSGVPGAITPPMRTLSCLCFIAGLACMNQHTIVFYVVPFATWVLVAGAHRHGWSIRLLSACAFWYQ